MKNFLHLIKSVLNALEIRPLLTFRAISHLPSFARDWSRLNSLRSNSDIWPLGELRPCLTDFDQESGQATGDYFHQDLYVAQKIYERRPIRHVDVGSRIDGFVAHVASFRQIEVLDIRPLISKVPHIQFSQLDLMQPLPPERLSCCDSLSCLHTLEHFGLGRYSDTIDPNGYKIGFAHLVQLLKPAGIFYFSVPIGPQRIEFNAHRVFSIQHLLDLFQQYSLEILRFSYVNDAGDLIADALLSPDLIQNNCHVHYGCGIFELRKTSTQ